MKIYKKLKMHNVNLILILFYNIKKIKNKINHENKYF